MIKGQLIGYARVSTTKQNTARQEEILSKYGCQKIFIDKMSGKDTNRPELKKMLEYVREGDVVVVEDISRFGRTLVDLISLVDTLNEKKVDFVSIKQDFNTSTPSGKLVFNIFASLSQFERETIKERQAEGIAIAKEQGKYKGRMRKIYDEYDFKVAYKKLKNKEITREAMKRQFGMSSSTLYRRIKELEAKDK